MLNIVQIYEALYQKMFVYIDVLMHEKNQIIQILT